MLLLEAPPGKFEADWEPKIESNDTSGSSQTEFSSIEAVVEWPTKLLDFRGENAVGTSPPIPIRLFDLRGESEEEISGLDDGRNRPVVGHARPGALRLSRAGARGRSTRARPRPRFADGADPARLCTP